MNKTRTIITNGEYENIRGTVYDSTHTILVYKLFDFIEQDYVYLKLNKFKNISQRLKLPEILSITYSTNVLLDNYDPSSERVSIYNRIRNPSQKNLNNLRLKYPEYFI